MLRLDGIVLPIPFYNKLQRKSFASLLRAPPQKSNPLLIPSFLQHPQHHEFKQFQFQLFVSPDHVYKSPEIPFLEHAADIEGYLVALLEVHLLGDLGTAVDYQPVFYQLRDQFSF